MKGASVYSVIVEGRTAAMHWDKVWCNERAKAWRGTVKPSGHDTEQLRFKTTTWPWYAPEFGPQEAA